MKYVIIYLLFLLCIFIGWQIFYLVTNENYYGWPAATKCRICDKTVWVWQNYERREYTVRSNSSMITGASGIVHKKCKGNPDFKINVEVK